MEQLLSHLISSAETSPVGGDATIGTIVALAMAAALGAVLGLNYHLTYTGKKDNRAQLVYTILLLCMGGALVWLIVADNLARAFGLAGALALIRYRTRMQDPKDTTMVFFAMVIGMACGLHQHFNALCGTAFICATLWAIRLVNNTGLFANGHKTTAATQKWSTNGRDPDENGRPLDVTEEATQPTELK